MWQDLQKADPRLLRSTVRRFMEVTEDLGHAMGEAKLEEQDVVVVVTSNICKLQKQSRAEIYASFEVYPSFFATFAITESRISLLQCSSQARVERQGLSRQQQHRSANRDLRVA